MICVYDCITHRDQCYGNGNSNGIHGINVLEHNPTFFYPLHLRDLKHLCWLSFSHSYMVKGRVTCRLCSSIQGIMMTMFVEHWTWDSMGGLVGNIDFPMGMRTFHCKIMLNVAIRYQLLLNYACKLFALYLIWTAFTYDSCIILSR